MTHLDGLAPRVGKEEGIQLGAGHDRDQLLNELQLGERVGDVDLGMRDLFHLRGHSSGDGRVGVSEAGHALQRRENERRILSDMRIGAG